MLIQVTPATPTLINNSKPENVMDSLLDELQEFALCGKSDLRSSEKQATSSSRPVRRSLDLGKKTAPQPPPRSSSSKINDQQDHLRQLMLLQNNLSNAKLHSADRPPPTLPKPNVTRSNSEPCAQNNETNVTIGNNLNNHSVGEKSTSNNVDKSPTECNGNNLKVQMALSISNTSLSSIDSQESVMDGSGNVSQRKSRKERLEERHQELLRKQRLLQEKYTQLQQLVRGELPQNLIDDLKKTSSESNLNGQKTQCKSSTNGDSIDTNECTKNIGNGHLTSQN